MQSIGTVSHRPGASVGMVAFSEACGLLTVQAKAGDNGNTEVEVRVQHLSSPSKVSADASVYVVWIRPRHAGIQNVGALQVDDDLVGSLKTNTSHAAFTLTVTPEPSARVAAPTHKAVFIAEVNRT